MARRTRYQQGSVQRDKRQSGPDVWVFRWREIGPGGKSAQRKAVIGTVVNLPQKHPPSKQHKHCASTPTNKPRERIVARAR